MRYVWLARARVCVRACLLCTHAHVHSGLQLLFALFLYTEQSCAVSSR